MLHVDVNSYFATLLQQEIPALRGRPVVVVKDVGRSCVIAASKEAKKIGISTGSVVGDARIRAERAAQSLVIVPAQFDMYWSATERLYGLLRAVAPSVELFSLDEAFVPYDQVRSVYASPTALARLIQANIQSSLGDFVTCNVGIGPNRFLAKMVGETAPKGSVSAVSWDTAPALLARTSFDDVCGIGTRLSRRLERIGVRVPYQINFIPSSTMESMFGPFWSKQLQRMALGQEPLFLTRLSVPLPHMKSVGRSITGFELCRTRTMIVSTLYNLITEVMYKVRRMHLAGRRVWLALYGHDERFSAHQTLAEPLQHVSAVFAVVKKLLDQWREPFPVIKMAVSLSLLSPQDRLQIPLLPDWHKRERVSLAIDAMAAKHGLFTITSGLLLKKKIIMPEVTGFLGDKTFQFGHML